MGGGVGGRGATFGQMLELVVRHVEEVEEDQLADARRQLTDTVVTQTEDRQVLKQTSGLRHVLSRSVCCGLCCVVFCSVFCCVLLCSVLLCCVLFFCLLFSCVLFCCVAFCCVMYNNGQK